MGLPTILDVLRDSILYGEKFIDMTNRFVYNYGMLTQERISRVTINDLAKAAGVAKSTVSDVLNSRKGGTRVSTETRERILALAKAMNYTPQSSARSLSTGRTYNIGFLLSSKVTLELANNYFACIMAGVQHACANLGYGCVVSAYDLSTIDNFVIPPKLKRKSVDGVVITGQVEAKVIELFVDKKVPFVMVGDTTEFPLNGILAVARDMVANWVIMLGHVTSLGHKKIYIPGYFESRARELLSDGISVFKHANPNVIFEIENPVLENIEHNQFELAYEAGIAWTKRDPQKRPTVMISNDQWCLGFLSAVYKEGYSCPKDVSVLCVSDASLFEWYIPPITSVDMGLWDCGKEAADILINLLEDRITLTDAYRRVGKSWKPGRLIVRKSTGKVPVL